jgi:hypothetical protein
LGGTGIRQRPSGRQRKGQLTKLVDGLIAVRLDDGDWFREGLGGAAAKVLNAEEADEIATHFATEGGREQRVVVDLLLIGETVLANYTFTNRIDSIAGEAVQAVGAADIEPFIEAYRRRKAR